MNRPIAGSRRAASSEVLHVDYAAVLDAAVRNERIETLRKARAAVLGVDYVDRTRGDSWNRPDRAGSVVHRDALAAIDRLLDDASAWGEER